MEESGRDLLGKFKKGRTQTLEEKRKIAEGIKKHYEKFTPSVRLREQNPYIFNSWRSIFYTKKGKSIGCDTNEWKVFENFYNDVSSTYHPGLTFHRIDTTLPFSKDNFIWVTREQARAMDGKRYLVELEYNGETHTLKDWALKYNLSIKGIQVRYHKFKDIYTTEEIVFGKKIARGSKTPKDALPNTSKERQKASKMISTYKCLDRKRGFKECDIDVDWMIDNIMHKPCVYCGDTHKVGCDRINNNQGHTKDNVVPCCYDCNTVRNNIFTFDEMKKLGKTIKEIKDARTLIR